MPFFNPHHKKHLSAIEDLINPIDSILAIEWNSAYDSKDANEDRC